MANPEHLAILRQGVKTWNRWRTANRDIRADLSGADLSEARLSTADLSEAILTMAVLWRTRLIGADLRRADLSGARLFEADLSRVKLGKADLKGADLSKAKRSKADLSGACLLGARLLWADLSKAKLIKADLRGADLGGAMNGANLCGANLHGANLSYARLVGVNLKNATIENCYVYGIAAWEVGLDGVKQANLVITPEDAPIITVDNLEVAQFIYLLLHNEKIRHVIDTITSKVVLILGRFTPERKAILDAIRDELRHRDYVPVLFDFEKPSSRDLTETITTLARMARFIIADITDAKSIPQELAFIIPHLPSVPVQPLLHTSATEYGMFEHFRRFPWVLEVFQYDSAEDVLNSLQAKVIDPAEAKANEVLATR
jgi:uncharacterized protein YjbI with pentapeptide repeats